MFYHKSMEKENRKTIAIIGATGGLGHVICHNLVLQNDLILLGRSEKKLNELKEELLKLNSSAKINIEIADLNDINSVKNACENLKKYNFSTLILNAGIYNVPRKITPWGFDNVYQVNFVSQYYMVKELLPYLRKKEDSKVVAVGSVAYNYDRFDENDFDFRTRKKSSLVYGNSKRFLMFSLYNLFKDEKQVKLCISHPGVTLTNITNHYPKWINWLVKIGIKLVFPSPKKAARSIIYGVNESCDYFEWLGPRIFNVWGKPKKQKLKKIKDNEDEKMFKIAEEIYTKLKKENS